jgi:autophagy-related protein 9
MAMIDPKEKAMWMWANVENLDNFLKDVYTYFLGNGIWSILLNRALSLLYVYLFNKSG